MSNLLSYFIEKGNIGSLPIWGETFTWSSTDYTGNISDLIKDEFFDDSGIGKKRNAERTLAVNLSQFTGSIPQIGDSIIYSTLTYNITEIESHDDNSISYRIRQKIGSS